MESGSGIDHFQEPVHGQREDSNAATPPSDGAPSAVAAEGGGADAASPSPLPAAPVDRPQESAREQAGGGGRGTHGSGSAALGANLKAKGPGDIPPGPSSAGSNLSIPSPDSAGPSGAGTPSSEALDSKELFEVFEQLVREAGAEKKKKKKPDEEQAKSSCPKKGLWSKLKNLFTRKKKWCFQNVTLPREFTDHVMMMALATALEVPLRLERLYGGGSAEDNIYTGPGVVRVTLLYTGNHYDIIYPRAPPAESSSRQDSQRESPAG
ncbi:hypothetical protein ACQ4PT_060002 [Festuca glaucescens]